MNIDFNNNTPIYMQIVESLKIHIISGKYNLGERLPSVRDLAKDLKVNPNTMQKALVELENLKLVYAESTTGRFITKDKKLIEKYKKNYAKNLTTEYIKNITQIGLNIEDIKSLIGGTNGTIKNK